MSMNLTIERTLESGQCWIAVHTEHDPQTYLIATDESFGFVAVRLLHDGALVDTSKSASNLFEDLEGQGYNLYLGSITIEVEG